MKTKIPFKQFCKDVVDEVRLIVNAKVVLNNLENHYKNKKLITQVSKKDFQTITVHRDYVPNVYLTIRIVKEDKFIVRYHFKDLFYKKGARGAAKRVIKEDKTFSSFDEVKDFINEIL